MLEPSHAARERPNLEAIVAEAQYSGPPDAEYMMNTLLDRRAKILKLIA